MPGVTQPGIIGTPDDIRNAIYMADQQATPALSMVRKDGPARSPIYQWQGDIPSNVSKDGRKDGEDLPANKDHSKDRGLLEVNAHMMQTTVHVGHKSEKTENVAGIGKGQLMAREITKGIAAQKEALEQVMCDAFDQNNETVEGSETRGYFNWLLDTAQGVRPVPVALRTPTAQRYTGTFANLDESVMEDIAEQLFLSTSSHGRRYYGYFGISLKRKVGDFSVHDTDVAGETAIRRRQVTDKTLSTLISVLEFDGALIEIHPMRNLRTDRSTEGGTPSRGLDARRSGLILKADDTFLKFNEEFEFYPNENRGGGDRGFISTIFYNCMGNPQSHGVLVPVG